MMFEAQIISGMVELKAMLGTALKEIAFLKGQFENDYASIVEVAEMKGVSRQAILRKINNGDLDPMREVKRNGKKIYIKRTAIHKITVRKSA